MYKDCGMEWDNKGAGEQRPVTLFHTAVPCFQFVGNFPSGEK